MPIYDYFCEKCDLDFEIVESIKDHEFPSVKPCPQCTNPAAQKPSCKIHFTGTKIEDAEFNPGLGKITKSKRHREELAKQLGVVEIGNEKPDTLHKHFDTSRTEKLKKAWDEA